MDNIENKKIELAGRRSVCYHVCCLSCLAQDHQPAEIKTVAHRHFRKRGWKRVKGLWLCKKCVSDTSSIDYAAKVAKANRAKRRKAWRSS